MNMENMEHASAHTPAAGMRRPPNTAAGGWTLARKLGLAFGTLVLISLLLGTQGLWQMSRIHTETEDIADNWLPSVQTLALMRASANQIRRSEPDHIFSVDDAGMDEIDKNIEAARKSLAATEKAYAQYVDTPEEKALWNETTQLRDAYFLTQERLLALSRQGDSAYKEAVAYYRGPSRNAFNAYVAAINTSAELAARKADASRTHAAGAYAAARTMSLALVALAALLGTVLAVAILRGVRRAIGGDPAAAALAVNRVADGDLSGSIEVAPGDQHSLMAALQRMQVSLTDVVSSVRANSESVATASAQIAQGNQDLSQRTEEQASALQQTAASMEQLSSTVKQNADNAMQANQLAKGASSVAIKGGEVVGEVVTTMKGINDSSKRIADIISVIDGIAFQTNILALNAAVEAARAGEQGRGFAVVAAEVRNLASRSAEAAKEIKSLITTSVERVEQGTALVNQAGTTMTEVVSAIQRVTDIAGEISAASTEQSTGVAQIGEAVGQMDQVTQQNAALVEESAAAAESLKGQAQALVQAVAFFKLSHHGAMAQSMSAATLVPVATASPSSVERRAPKRAIQATRPRSGTKALHATPVAFATTGAAASVATEAGGWDSF